MPNTVSGGPSIRHVVVEGALVDPEADPARARRAERRALQVRLDSAALLAVAAQLPLPGALLLLVWPLGLWALWGSAAPATTGVWAFASAAVAVALLRSPRWAGAASTPVLVTLVVAALAAAVVPLSGHPALRAPWAAAAAAIGIASAASLAPLPLTAGLAAALPLTAAAIAAFTGSDSAPAAVSLAWLMAGAAGSTAAGGLAWQRRRAWRQNTRSLIEQGDRLRTLQTERDVARRTDSEKSRFLAIASHDLRQPVHALGLFAATLHKRLKQSPDEPLARYLVRSVDALERSFNAMLDISRLDGGAVSPQLQTFPLRDLFRRLQMQYGGQAELAGLGLRFSPGGKSVTSDPQLLERILGNLIQNAVKYTVRGGIVVVARSTESHVNVEVWDTGCGIDAGELPRIFDEFYQVGRGEKRDRAHGLGMGLAIVKRLAALLGHRLEVASVAGRGALFRIGIPIGGLPGIQDDLAPADTVPMTVSPSRTVLVVDDEEPIREGLRLLLQEWGYHAMTAADAGEAEQAVSALEGRIDLIVSDLHLGGGPDGREVVATVRRLCGRDVPAILVTGATTHAEVERVASGSDPVLFKPVQPRRLFDAMRAVIG